MNLSSTVGEFECQRAEEEESPVIILAVDPLRSCSARSIAS